MTEHKVRLVGERLDVVDLMGRDTELFHTKLGNVTQAGELQQLRTASLE